MLIVSILSGCVGKNTAVGKNGDNSGIVNPTGFPIVNKQITLKVMGSKAPNHVRWEDMDFFKEMEAKTNIKLEYTAIPSDQFIEKKNIAFAANELPDFFFPSLITSQDELNYGKQGLLIPLEKYIDKYAPNLAKILSENDTIKKAITSPDGHIYTLPCVNETPRDMTGKVWINQKWLDKLKLKMPETIDEFYSVLKAFKQNDPNGNGIQDEIPLSYSGLYHFTYLFGSFGVLGKDVFVNDNNVVEFVPITSGFKDAIKFYNKLNNEKLLDPDSVVQNASQQKAKTSGKEVYGCFMSAAPYITVGTSNNNDYVVLPPLKGQDGRQMWIKFNTISRGAFAITNKCKYPEALMRWVDYLYSAEGSSLIFRGVPDVNYKSYPDGTWEQIIPDGFSPDEARGKATPGAGGIGPYIFPVDIVLNQKQGNSLNGYIDVEVKKLLPFLRSSYPQIMLSQEQQSRISTIAADIVPYVEQTMAKGITGAIDIDAEWDNYVQKIKKMKIDEYVSIYQKAYDDFIKK